MHFSNWRDYDNFAKNIRQRNRFGFDEKSKVFTTVFREQILSRIKTIKKGTNLYRAVRDYENRYDEHGIPIGLGPACVKRMLPRQEFAYEGRVNPSGILVLYLATNPNTAISEIRPWKGELVSVGVLEVTKNIEIVDLSIRENQSGASVPSLPQFIGEEPISEEETDDLVWSAIDNAFSEPTTRTDSGAEYSPTQLLTEIVKELGYEGVVYKSSFGGELGYNIALFDVNSAEIRKCELHEISDLKVTSAEIANPWFKPKKKGNT